MIDMGHTQGLNSKNFIAAILCILVPTVAFAADNNYKVSYDGGSIQSVNPGSPAEFAIEQKQVRLVKDKKDLAVIPASSITEVSYGQDVHRRVGAVIGLAVVSFGIGALMAPGESKKHFIGITFTNGDRKGGFVMQCDKNEYRGILMALQGITGKKAVDADAMTVKN
jgi:hypothetical protein